MPQSPINLYGDQLIATSTGHGADISSQRADDLDLMAVEQVRTIGLARGSISVMDVGCGHGGQAARMAAAGAYVVAVDAVNYGAEVAASMAREMVQPGQFSFRRLPVENEPTLGSFDIVMCQRMIHYLKHDAACAVLGWFYRSANSGGYLFCRLPVWIQSFQRAIRARPCPCRSASHPWHQPWLRSMQFARLSVCTA